MRIQGSIITVVDPSKCQTSIRKVKALDVQMLINAPPLQLSGSNGMGSSAKVILESELRYFCSRYKNIRLSALSFIESFFVVQVCFNLCL